MATTEPGIRIAVHDASRVEWVTQVPLPITSGDRTPFRVEFELEVPAQLYVSQDHWRSLQVMSRLQSPTEHVEAGAAGDSADGLRAVALSLAHQVKAHRQELTHECFMANTLLSLAPSERQLARLLVLLRAAEDDVLRVRSRLETMVVDRPEIVQERALVAEFVSNQLLEFLLQAQRAIHEHLLRPDGPQTEPLHDTAAALVHAIHETLQREIDYRSARGFLSPTSDHPEVLERHLERVSLLKKHFHELLFLSPETSIAEAQLRNYGTIVGAMFASVFGFILNRTGLLGHSASLGLVVAALVGAVVYAMQDRIKDLGKSYLPSKLGKRYAQRTTRLVVPPRWQPTDSTLISTVEESITAKLHSRPDPLNPELGARRAVHVVHYASRGVSEVHSELTARGIVSLKQIFRYDLSWLFTRLDDSRKQVPVLGAEGLRVVDAPRFYRMPVRVQLTVGDRTYGSAATAVMHKGGLARLELEPTTDPAIAPVFAHVS